MYYTYPCPYCGRVFYTYNLNKEAASHTLYNGIKQHLIAYNEDAKEYEMDDGEQIDSDQIYAGMSESKYIPADGYEATLEGIEGTSLDTETTSTPSAGGSTSSSTSALPLLFLFVLLIGILVGLFVFFPNVISTLQGLLSTQ